MIEKLPASWSKFLKAEIQQLEIQLKKDEEPSKHLQSYSKNVVEETMGLVEKNNSSDQIKNEGKCWKFPKTQC